MAATHLDTVLHPETTILRRRRPTLTIRDPSTILLHRHTLLQPQTVVQGLLREERAEVTTIEPTRVTRQEVPPTRAVLRGTTIAGTGQEGNTVIRGQEEEETRGVEITEQGPLLLPQFLRVVRENWGKRETMTGVDRCLRNPRPRQDPS